MLVNDEPRTNSSMLQRRRLGMELRRLRTAAGLTLGQVGEELYRSSSTISRVERGRVGVTPRDVRDMLRLYGVETQQQEALLQLALGVGRRDPFWQAHGDVPPEQRTYVGLEKSAALIRQYECLAIPGLLQLRQYAAALSRVIFPHATVQHIERHVGLRMTRQALLLDDDPPGFEAVLDEAVLRRPVGGPDVMRAQLNRLAVATEMPNVTLQVIPFEAGEHGGMAGPFTILSFRDSVDLDEIYLEYSAGETMTNTSTQVQRHKLLFDQLKRAALSPEVSAAFICEMANRFGAATP